MPFLKSGTIEDYGVVMCPVLILSFLQKASEK